MMNRLLSRCAFLLCLGVVASAQTPEAAPPRAARMAQALGLSEAQKASIKAIHQKHREALQARREAASQARRAFHDAARSPEATEAQLRPLHQAAADKGFDLMMARRAMRMEVRQVLTPEQREKAAERMEKARERRRGRFSGR